MLSTPVSEDLTSAAEPHPARVGRARLAVSAFLTLTLLISGVFQWLLLRTGDPIEKHVGLVLGLMWTPGLVSIALRLVLREGFADVSFRLGGWRGVRWSLWAWVYPVAIGGAAYGLAWATGLAHFGFPARDTALSALAPNVRFFVLLALTCSIGVLLSAISAAGEEIGWRGYLLTRLVEARVPKPVLTSGLIWGFWHVPLILSGQYASGPYPALSALLFMVSIVAAGYFVARLRLESGSVWPAILMHSAWNSIIQGSFDGATQGQSVFVGESGVFVAGFSVLFALVFGRGVWKRFRSPGVPVP
ncbi:MAG: CPBP family glutamic-type intramembrane protease [Polyangiaceae bacterium]